MDSTVGAVMPSLSPVLPSMRWTSLRARETAGRCAVRASHAVVVYQDGDRTYMMDNQSWTPQWIHNASPVQMAQQFSGINCSVKMARVINDGGVGTPKSPITTNTMRRYAVN